MCKLSLLKKLDECEYPEDFLVARLHGKKGGLFRNWEFLLTSNNPVETLQKTPFYPYLKKYAVAGVWRFLRNEHLWVYKRMNRKLRHVFTPYFVYHEINTLVNCLRHLHCKNDDKVIAQQLIDSLLHNDIETILKSRQDFPDMLKMLESFFVSRASIFYGLTEHYKEHGFQALEQFLREKSLTFISLQNLTPRLKIFLEYMVDFHNCMTLAKSIRWQMDQEPAFTNEGSLETVKLKRIFLRKDLLEILKCFPISCRDEAISSATELETMLLNLITKELRRWSYERTMVGTILFYLWEQFRYARNISMVLSTVHLEDEAVGKSIIA